MKRLSKARWYIDRFRTMSLPEVGHRVRESGLSRLPFRPGTAALAPKWRAEDFEGEYLSELWQLLPEVFAGNACLENARSALLGSVTVFGDIWSVEKLDWTIDPSSGFQWPRINAFRLGYRHSSGSDPKWAWEVNRLLFLIPVIFAKGAGLISPHGADEFVKRVLDDWLSASKVGRGIEWAASIEAALRVIALTMALQSLDDDDPQLTVHCGRALAEHVAWIKRFPSLYSSANNHRVAEICALLIAESNWFGAVDEENVRELEFELQRIVSSLFASDGIGLEQSPTYAGFSLELIGLALRCHSWRSCESKAAIEQTAIKSAQSLFQFTTETGEPLRIGDDDEGAVVTVGIQREKYVEAICALLNTGELARTHGLVTFAEGGYSILRHAECESVTLWSFDHGPLGFGAIAAHGHADALSVTLRAGGVDWLVDAGTYKYHGDKKWRAYFRSTAAHCAPQVNALDSSVPTGDFNWDPRLRAEASLVLAEVSGTDYAKVHAKHDGYVRRLSGGGEIWRSLERIDENHYRITDEYVGTGTLTAGFLLHPKCRIEKSGNVLYLSRPDSSMKVVIKVTEAGSFLIERKDEHIAWYSAAFGNKETTNRLVLSAIPQLTSKRQILTTDFMLQNESGEQR